MDINVLNTTTMPRVREVLNDYYPYRIHLDNINIDLSQEQAEHLLWEFARLGLYEERPTNRYEQTGE